MDIQSLLEADHCALSWFNGSDSLFLDNWMTILTSSSTWIPLYIGLLYLVIKNNETMSQIFLTIGCVLGCVLLSDVVADFIVKPFVGRWRPSNDPFVKYTVEVVRGMRGTGYSFFSAHASNTFALALFICMLVKSKTLSISMIIWSLINCYTRMYLGMHYPLDILCGLVWGATCGLLVYYVYYRLYSYISQKNNFVSSQYTSTGYLLDDVDVVEFVFVTTIVVSILLALCMC